MRNRGAHNPAAAGTEARPAGSSRRQGPARPNPLSPDAMPTLPLLPLLLALAPATQDIEPFEFDARAAEHLLSRAGFGATTDEVEAAVEAGLDATIERLIAGGDRARDPFWAERLSARNMSRRERLSEARERGGARSPRGMGEDQRRDLLREFMGEQRRLSAEAAHEETESEHPSDPA